MQIISYFYQSGGLFKSKSKPLTRVLAKLAGQLSNHKLNDLHNLQTINNGCYMTATTMKPTK